MKIEKIRTERLELTPVTLDDMERIYEIASDPRSIEDFQYVPKSVNEVQGWFEDAVEGGDPTWSIFLNGTIIGLIEAGIRQSGATSEPGYFIDMAYQTTATLQKRSSPLSTGYLRTPTSIVSRSASLPATLAPDALLKSAAFSLRAS